MSQNLHHNIKGDCALWAAERVGCYFREEKLAWEQAQWAQNNASFSWRAAAPLRAAETVAKRVSMATKPKTALEDLPPTLLVPADGAELPAAASLSVVIPTLNAGIEFEQLLHLLCEQKGLVELEIVVVDSGSTDETVALAGRYGATVKNIPSHEFTHSHARNVGAELSNGDYLLFMTQDALPEGNFWARRLLEPLLNQEVHAVTCSEKSRPDADLYSIVSTWQYKQNSNSANGQDYIGTLPLDDSYLPMLKNAGISNVACAMTSITWDKYRFCGLFAEDLDLGVRLLHDGGKIGFLSSVPVIHSHNRPSYYFLKRSYVNVIYVSEILPSMPISSLSLQEFLFSALASLKRLLAYKQFLLCLDDMEVSELLLRSQDFFAGMSIMGYGYQYNDPPDSTGDKCLDDIINRLWRLSPDYTPLEMDFAKEFLQGLESGVFAYYAYIGSPIIKMDYPQICDIVLKRFATWLGEQLAGLTKNGETSAAFVDITKELLSGV